MVQGKVKVTLSTYEILKKKYKEAHENFVSFKQRKADDTDGPRDSVETSSGFNNEHTLKKNLEIAEKTFDNCIPVDNPEHTNYVVLGHHVTIKRNKVLMSKSKIDGLAIRGNGLICSVATPLGQAVLGKKVGNKFNVKNESNGKIDKIEIMSISLA